MSGNVVNAALRAGFLGLGWRWSGPRKWRAPYAAPSPGRSDARQQSVRLVYLDEVGISHEETTVVVGLIVEPDRKYLDLEARVRALVKVIVPESHQADYAFIRGCDI